MKNEWYHHHHAKEANILTCMLNFAKPCEVWII